MEKEKAQTILLHQENRALRIYLLFFYLVFLINELAYYYIFPKFINKTPIFESYGFTNYLMYFILLGLLPITYMLIKMNYSYLIKYIFFYSYSVIILIQDLYSYIGSNAVFSNGNVTEVVLLLFSPLFINKFYFWTVSIGTIVRYTFGGIIIKSTTVVLPIVLILIITIVMYILLNQFTSYIQALTATHNQLRHKEKLAVIGQLATSIGHEIRNSLQSLKGFTQLQSEKYPSDKQYYSIMEQEIKRINSILSDILVVGKPRSEHFIKTSINETVEFVNSMVQEMANQYRVRISLNLDPNDPIIECDENQIKQVLLNLVKNGVEAMDDGGTLTIETQRIPHQNLLIRVVDEGCGIEADKLDNLGEPFYTTKDDGTGLGLMATKKIVEDHHGSIRFESEINKGTKVEVVLPIAQP